MSVRVQTMRGIILMCVRFTFFFHSSRWNRRRGRLRDVSFLLRNNAGETRRDGVIIFTLRTCSSQGCQAGGRGAVPLIKRKSNADGRLLPRAKPDQPVCTCRRMDVCMRAAERDTLCTLSCRQGLFMYFCLPPRRWNTREHIREIHNALAQLPRLRLIHHNSSITTTAKSRIHFLFFIEALCWSWMSRLLVKFIYTSVEHLTKIITTLFKKNNKILIKISFNIFSSLILNLINLFSSFFIPNFCFKNNHLSF